MRCFAHCWRGKLQNIEDSSLVIIGYQLFPLATSKLMGDSKEFNDSSIFWAVLLIVGGGEFNDSGIFWGVLLMVGLWKLQNIEDSFWPTYLQQIHKYWWFSNPAPSMLQQNVFNHSFTPPCLYMPQSVCNSSDLEVLCWFFCPPLIFSALFCLFITALIRRMGKVIVSLCQFTP